MASLLQTHMDAWKAPMLISLCHDLPSYQCSAAHGEACQGRQAMLCLTVLCLGSMGTLTPHCWGAQGAPSLLTDPSCPCCVTEKQICLASCWCTIPVSNVFDSAGTLRALWQGLPSSSAPEATASG